MERKGKVSVAQLHLTVTPWTVARQASLSMEFSRQEYWSGLPFLPPGGLPNPGTEPGSLALPADSLLTEPPGNPSKKVEYEKKGEERLHRTGC